VELCGVVDAVQPYLNAADIFVLPSRSEQSGSLSVIEAMRTGLPTIASSCDGIPEDFGPADSGILVEPGSVASLAEAMTLLAQDAGLRARYAAGARAAFEARFSAEAFCADLTAAYAQAGIELDPGA
jgi:glycosyltransferase involved in cell wall biosynthesis